jgi:hypothetical protein
MVDKIKITILEDGQLQIETEGISGKNHCSADELLSTIAKLTGKLTKTTKKRHGHTHIVNGQTIKHSH